MPNFFVNLFNTVWDSIRWAFITFRVVDVLDIIVVAFFIYELIVFVRSSRAKVLIKGIFLVIVMWILASFLSLNMTKWIFETTMSVGIIALVVLFQPEIRSALENLGQTRLWRKIFTGDHVNETLSAANVEEILQALTEMSRVKTGALICIEESIALDDYIKTGIPLNSRISSQLLVNIFEKNTPLHDGAVIVRDNRVEAATCYLPLSQDDKISKELGTRHRAAIGLSEETDSRVLVVSEETGAISMAFEGKLYRDVDVNFLRSVLVNSAQNTTGVLSSLRGDLAKLVHTGDSKKKSSGSRKKGGDEQ